MRRKVQLLLGLLGPSLAFIAPTTSADSTGALSLGTTGVGLEWMYSLHETLNVRVVAQYGGYEFDYEETDIDYNGDYESINFGAILDWRPFSGGFRISGGLVATNFGAELDATSRGQEIDLGENTYISSDGVTLSGEAEFNDVAPYLSIGWSSNLKKDGLYFGGEAGVMYVGSARLGYGATGCVSLVNNPANCIDVNSFSEFQDDLEQERQDIENDLEDFSLWPILSFSIGYRF